MKSARKNPYNYRKLREAFDARRRPSITIGDIAKTLDKSEIYIYKILNGEKFAEQTVLRLADILGVDHADLVKSRRA